MLSAADSPPGSLVSFVNPNQASVPDSPPRDALEKRPEVRCSESSHWKVECEYVKTIAVRPMAGNRSWSHIALRPSGALAEEDVPRSPVKSSLCQHAIIGSNVVSNHMHEGPRQRCIRILEDDCNFLGARRHAAPRQRRRNVLSHTHSCRTKRHCFAASEPFALYRNHIGNVGQNEVLQNRMALPCAYTS
jgi:hypothetical protein